MITISSKVHLICLYHFCHQTIGVISSSTAGGFRGKSGNAEIVGGGNPNQSGSSPKERYIRRWCLS